MKFSNAPKRPFESIYYLHAGQLFMFFFCLQIIFNVTFINYISSVKPLGPRSGATFCLVWSGSKLFVTMLSMQRVSNIGSTFDRKNSECSAIVFALNCDNDVMIIMIDVDYWWWWWWWWWLMMMIIYVDDYDWWWWWLMMVIDDDDYLCWWLMMMMIDDYDWWWWWLMMMIDYDAWWWWFNHSAFD